MAWLMHIATDVRRTLRGEGRLTRFAWDRMGQGLLVLCVRSNSSFSLSEAGVSGCHLVSGARVGCLVGTRTRVVWLGHARVARSVA